ncbi:hypothetical protein BGZ54_002385 [Gamsiella multidivaricata]|nr:hypothetical protein BGZ54_002385 [Gamsiella multidivaricata]
MLRQQPSHIQPNTMMSSGFMFQDDASIRAMANTSVMSYTHPDDIRTLCRGLDRVCKSLAAPFRIRWRVPASQQRHPINTEDPELPLERKEGSLSRIIEFKGESFEEWVDPSAVPDPKLTSRAAGLMVDHQDDDKKYMWTEIRGVHSNGQPMLVVRPLTAEEVQEQREQASMAAGLVIPTRESRQYAGNGGQEQGGKEWKSKSKQMGVDEAMRLPRQLGISALTTLSTASSCSSSSRPDEVMLRMPGSLPPSALSTSVACCWKAPGAMDMSSSSSSSAEIAYPSTSSSPWTVFLAIAFDAWKQWNQTVHAGQAQFRDWCEYVLEATIDQLIEGVSLGMTLLRIENGPECEGLGASSHSNAIQDRQQQRQLMQGTQEDCEEVSIETWVDCRLDPDQQHHHRRPMMNAGQRKLSEMHRVEVILKSYPNIERVIRKFGNTWLGRKFKSRLQQKLDMAAGQVVQWWCNKEVEEEGSSLVVSVDQLNAAEAVEPDVDAGKAAGKAAGTPVVAAAAEAVET